MVSFLKIEKVESIVPEGRCFTVTEIRYVAYNVQLESTYLEIIGDDQDEKIYKIVFKPVEAFSVADEGNLFKLWMQLPKGNAPPPSIFLIHDSLWIKEMVDEQTMLCIHSGDNLDELKHFVITSEDDCVQVLSFDYPEISEITA